MNLVFFFSDLDAGGVGLLMVQVRGKRRCRQRVTKSCHTCVSDYQETNLIEQRKNWELLLFCGNHFERNINNLSKLIFD